MLQLLLRGCFLFMFALRGLLAAEDARAAAHAPRPEDQAPFNGKRVVALNPVRQVRIEMPDQGFHDFGIDYEARLKTRLQNTGRFVVADPRLGSREARKSSELKSSGIPDFSWTGSYVPAAEVLISVEALSFVTGSRGSRMFYGFEPDFRTPFNSGEISEDTRNEFPLRSVSFEPNWFDRHFDKRGDTDFGSLSGLDLGEGFRVDALFAWLAVKYARYRAHLRLNVRIEAPLGGKSSQKFVDVLGEGFFFDAAGAYQGYSAGIRVARTDAMLKAVARAVDGSLAAIESGLSVLPLTGRIDSIVQDGDQTWYLVGTGYRATIMPGVRYHAVENESLVFEAAKSLDDGVVARLISGDASNVRPGLILREAGFSGAQGPELKNRNLTQKPEEVRIQLPDLNLPKPSFEPGQVPTIPIWKAIWRSLADTATLLYRVYRYSMYDRPYRAAPDGFEGGDMPSDPSSEPPSDEELSQAGMMDWVREARGESWARQIGLDRVPVSRVQSGARAPRVALIDTGVDYNHPAIHQALFTEGGGSRRYGWDFISGDSRPSDDHYHGTEVASLVVAVEPGAKLIPLKVFNPWGITSSAALYGAFEEAVRQKADVIVCAWATRQRSRAIEQGVELARRAGILVVAAAGDRGDDLSQVAAYPASLAAREEGILSVTGVDSRDRLTQERGKFANRGGGIGIAAPGLSLRVAEPRARFRTRVTSTALSSGIVAGAIARLRGMDPSLSTSQILSRLKQGSIRVPDLDGAVEGGLSLRIRD